MYVAVGTRVWISVTRKGTFSLDTQTGMWTTEGTWQLSFEGRALHVPEIDCSRWPHRGDSDAMRLRSRDRDAAGDATPVEGDVALALGGAVLLATAATVRTRGQGTSPA